MNYFYAYGLTGHFRTDGAAVVDVCALGVLSNWLLWLHITLDKLYINLVHIQTIQLCVNVQCIL